MRVWEIAAEKSGIYKVEDFQRAAYALMTQQVIYEDARTKVNYRLIKAHLASFREVFALFDLDVLEGHTADHILALPRRESSQKLTTEVTLLVLTLRKVYDQQAKEGAIEAGRATVSIEDLSVACRELTGRELPSEVSALRLLLAQTQRMGMCRVVNLEKGAEQPFEIVVLPGIEGMVSLAVMGRIGSLYWTESADDSVQTGAEEEIDNAAA